MRSCNRRRNTLQYAKSILLGLDGALPSRLAGLLEEGAHQDLIDCALDVSKYSCRDEFFSDYAAVSLLSKYDNFDLGIDRAKVAWDKFLAAEEVCRLTNIRLSAFNRTVFTFTDRLPSIIQMARGKIERLLPRFNWDRALHYMHFSSGASLDVPRKKGDSWYKYGLKGPTTTGANAMLANCLIRQFPQWETIALDFSRSSSGLEIVRGDRITTVPKNAKTDRVIAVQPTMNLIVQKGIGGEIRSMLKRVGIDLNSQERNQRLAKRGSEDGSLATIDLKAASDTIATGLVELLMPEDWVLAMKICRCPEALCPDGTFLRYHKFSSMGNGFTFELESLLFWALSEATVAVCGGSVRDVSVYGDDIIVPADTASELIKVLRYVGFETNADKTFIDGPFRESCGKHYFYGSDVTPIYIRKDVDTLERKFWLANSIRDLAYRKVGAGYGMDGGLRASWDTVVSSLPPRHQRPSIPRFVGDVGLVGDFDEVRPRRASNWLDGFNYQARIPVPDKRKIHGEAALIKTLREGCSSHVTSITIDALLLLKRTGRFADTPINFGGVDLAEIPLASITHRKVNLFVQQWVGHGPWLAPLRG